MSYRSQTASNAAKRHRSDSDGNDNFMASSFALEDTSSTTDTKKILATMQHEINRLIARCDALEKRCSNLEKAGADAGGNDFACTNNEAENVDNTIVELTENSTNQDETNEEGGSNNPVQLPEKKTRMKRRRRPKQPSTKHSKRGREMDFDEMYEMAIEYKEKHGNFNIPRSYEDNEFRGWVRNWRVRKHNFEKTCEELGGKEKVFHELDEDKLQNMTGNEGRKVRHLWKLKKRIDKLNDIGFDWGGRQQTAPSFEDRVKELGNWMKDHNGDFFVSSRDPDVGNTLGQWLKRQRAKFNKKDEIFMKEDYPKLQAIGVDFNKSVYDFRPANRTLTHDDHFEEMCKNLMDYKIQYGDFHVSAEIDSKLAVYVSDWRSKKAKYDRILKEGNELAASSEQKDVPRNNESDEDETGNDSQIEDDDVDGGNANMQRRKRWMEIMKKRVEKLDAMGFAWESPASRPTFEDQIQSLKEYHAAVGNYRVHRSFGPLGEWVYVQRKKYHRRDEKFMKERYPRLSEIGFDWEL